jgi:hypothetical protein
MNIGPTVMINLDGYADTTGSKTVFESARNALDFFLPPYAPSCTSWPPIYFSMTQVIFRGRAGCEVQNGVAFEHLS